MSKITIGVQIEKQVDIVWSYWTKAAHIKHWYFASEDWWVPWVEQQFEVGHKFIYRMASKDGKMGFDFTGRYTDIKANESITYVLEDDREVITTFEVIDDTVYLKQVFETEDDSSAEMQKQGWQAILNQFKGYTESDWIRFTLQKHMETTPEVVYHYLTDNDKYMSWAHVFSDDSKFYGDWVEGGEITFVDHRESGTVALVENIIPNELIHMKHIKLLKGDSLDETSDEALIWIGTLERYELHKSEDGVLVDVMIECHESYVGFIRDSWIEALNEIERNINN